MLSFSHHNFTRSTDLLRVNKPRNFAQIPSMSSASISKMRLTKSTTSTKMTAPRNIEGGRGNPFKVGDKPQSKAVFFCPSFLAQSNFGLCKFVMAALRWRLLWSVAPTCGISTRFNAVTNTVESISDGYSTQKVGTHR